VVTKSGSIMRLMAVGDKSPYHSLTGVLSAIACLRQPQIKPETTVEHVPSISRKITSEVVLVMMLDITDALPLIFEGSSRGAEV